MIAPAETTTIVDVRTEEDMMEVLNDTNRSIAQAFCLSKCLLCRESSILDVDVSMEGRELIYITH